MSDGTHPGGGERESGRVGGKSGMGVSGCRSAGVKPGTWNLKPGAPTVGWRHSGHGNVVIRNPE